MNPQQLENIQKMETLLSQIEHFNDEARQFLEKWENMLPKVQELDEYYGSEQWRADHEASNKGEIPEGISHGVLGEDLAYFALTDQYLLAVEYLKLVTKIIGRQGEK